MKLHLDRDDLREEFKDRACSAIGYAHFKPATQKAIVDAGEATFYEFDHRNYNRIIVPMVTCPKCFSDCVIENGGSYRCNDCGKEFE